MNFKTVCAGIGAACILGGGMFTATSASARLTAGNFNLGNIQQICLKKDGTWYGETFSGWSGYWEYGPTKDDSTLLVGNYSTDGNDSMVVTSSKQLDWSEWHDSTGFVNFIDATVSRIHAPCSPPAASSRPHKANPQD
jgi:hypothetical protein